MTQQVNPRDLSAQPGQTVFESHIGGLRSDPTPSTNSTRESRSNNLDSDNGTTGNNGPEKSRWPSLLNIRQVVVAFAIEAVTNSRPLRNKLNVMIIKAWQHYLAYARLNPLLTTFLSCLVFLAAGPILVFACVTGVSLGILVGTAAVIVVVIQSVIVSIAGAILLFILGTILFMTIFAFLWLMVAYMGIKFLRNVRVAYREKLEQQQYQQKGRNEGQKQQ
ncbi:hypothetical protein BGZ51_004990 [Haplosporangium sp. Z 767]|nr:hypothetical protein BGZ51_004990 [Haplosporangium sp. Z 767]KAF9182947.1 hypothetical protein BGZ50_004609 [Haplosporangium sp. Z 11]